MIKYISTRGEAPILDFSQAIMTGLARDGGLYLPQEYPFFSAHALRFLRGKPYTEVAKAILWPFIEGEIERNIFEKMVEEAYASFDHPATCPIVQTRPNEFILELFHGPTLAFKDVAMQLLSRFMHYFLRKKKTKSTIIGATSGDTGGAAIEAFRHVPSIDVFILFPENRISPVQQKQMTSHKEKNVHALAIQGNFDDCQSLVKALFNDHAFRDQVHLAGVNSINWARIMAQIVYYFYAAIAIGAPDRAVSFTVPTGNFGDIFAGFVASRMGLPIAHLNIATNDNDILTRTLETGQYKVESLIPTSSPSMDIQISSNFERLLFETYGRDASLLCQSMQELQQKGQFSLSKNDLDKMRLLFRAGRANMAETAETIRQLYQESHYLADPHTAVAVKVAREHSEKHIPMIILSTAHPAKFPACVEEASGIVPPIPTRLEKKLHGEEYFSSLPKDEERLKKFILEHI